MCSNIKYCLQLDCKINSIDFQISILRVFKIISINYYKFLLYQPNQSPAGYYENTSLCNAGSDPAFLAMQWTIEMTSLISVLGYTAGQYIFVEEIAVGARGASRTSLPSYNIIQAHIIPQASPGSFHHPLQLQISR